MVQDSKKSNPPKGGEKKQNGEEKEIKALTESDIKILKTYVCISCNSLLYIDIAPAGLITITIMSSPIQGNGPYTSSIKSLEKEVTNLSKHILETTGIFEYSIISSCTGVRESDTGLTPPSQWNLMADRQMLASGQPLQV